jgi:hypothetical protein
MIFIICLSISKAIRMPLSVLQTIKVDGAIKVIIKEVDGAIKIITIKKIIIKGGGVVKIPREIKAIKVIGVIKVIKVIGVIKVIKVIKAIKEPPITVTLETLGTDKTMVKVDLLAIISHGRFALLIL